MGFYDSAENVEKYVAMAEGYDGKELIEQMGSLLPDGSSILEIGMGPGVDLDILVQRYQATGSDNSEVFLDRYRRRHPGAQLLHLDAVTLETDQRFDAIFSNKVLHHLGDADRRLSFQRQAAILNPRGYAFHSFWYGDEVEEFEGMMFYQATEASIKTFVGESFEVLEIRRYTEMEPDDSLFAILRLR